MYLEQFRRIKPRAGKWPASADNQGERKVRLDRCWEIVDATLNSWSAAHKVFNASRVYHTEDLDASVDRNAHRKMSELVLEAARYIEDPQIRQMGQTFYVSELLAYVLLVEWSIAADKQDREGGMVQAQQMAENMAKHGTIDAPAPAYPKVEYVLAHQWTCASVKEGDEFGVCNCGAVVDGKAVPATQRVPSEGGMLEHMHQLADSMLKPTLYHVFIKLTDTHSRMFLVSAETEAQVQEAVTATGAQYGRERVDLFAKNGVAPDFTLPADADKLRRKLLGISVAGPATPPEFIPTLTPAAWAAIFEGEQHLSFDPKFHGFPIEGEAETLYKGQDLAAQQMELTKLRQANVKYSERYQADLLLFGKAQEREDLHVALLREWLAMFNKGPGVEGGPLTDLRIRTQAMLTYMPPARYKALQSGEAKLTPEEIAAGWFFDDEYDGLLANRAWPGHEGDCV